MRPAVAADQRYTRAQPCPICGGCERDPRGQGQRCIGYLSGDGDYARCSRSEHAGRLNPEPETQTFVHWLAGECRCGSRHGAGGTLGGTSHRGRIVAEYVYRGADGDQLYQVVRLEPKGFRQRRRNHGGGWEWTLGNVARVLYRLPELRAADPTAPVFVPEGEKDVDNLVTKGLVATTNAGGAGKWRSEYAESLRGRAVVVLPDNDPIGRKHAEQVRAALEGVATSVRVLELEGLPEKGDVSDWLAAGHTVEELVRLARSAPTSRAGEESGRGPRARVIQLSEIAPQEVAWLWPARIPAGMVALLDGDGGMGKSTIVIDLIARLTTGRPLPNEVRASRPVTDVVMLGHEDSPQHTIRPRLDAAGADSRRVHLLADVGGRMPQLPDHAGEIERVVAQTGARLLVIDPISAYIGRVDLHRDNEVRDALNPLVLMAERTGAAVLMLRHLRKSGGGASAIHRGLGSVAIMAVARTGMMLLKDPDDPTGRILTWPKLTVAVNPSSLRWRWIIGEGAPRVEWLGTCDLTADEILFRQDRDGVSAGAAGKVHDAEEFLRRELAAGPRRAVDVETVAKEAGISLTGALKRARASLVTPEKRRDGRWWWLLRVQGEQATPSANDASLAPLARLEEEQQEQEEQDYRSRESAPLATGGVDL